MNTILQVVEVDEHKTCVRGCREKLIEEMRKDSNTWYVVCDVERSSK